MVLIGKAIYETLDSELKRTFKTHFLTMVFSCQSHGRTYKILLSTFSKYIHVSPPYKVKL